MFQRSLALLPAMFVLVPLYAGAADPAGQGPTNLANGAAAPQGGNDSVWIDIDSPVMTAQDGRKHKAGSTGDANNRHVRHRMFAIVDRTQMSKQDDGPDGGCAASCSNNLKQIGLGAHLAAGGGANQLELNDTPGRTKDTAAKQGGLTSLKSLRDTSSLFANSRGGEQGAAHHGGVLVALGDGSVRSGDNAAGANGLAAQGQPSTANQNPPPPPPPPPRTSPLPVLMVLPNQDYQTGAKGLAASGGAGQGAASVGGNKTQTIGAGQTFNVNGAKPR